MVVFSYLLLTEESPNQMDGFCGVIDTGVSNYSEEALLGKGLFASSCAQCHARNMNTDATGPALENTFSKWNNDTLSYMSYLNNSTRYFEQHTDTALVKVQKKYEIKVSHRNQFNRSQIRALLAYINTPPRVTY